MVESTAGIGEAGALINRAKAPATMDITRGIQMAESSALKKAQLEAAKEAKKQALEERMSKYARTNFGKFKNVGVAKEAKEKALELFSKKKMALESGNYDLENELDIETDYLGNYLASKDNAISELKSSKKYDYANKVGELINSGKEEEANKFSKPYAPVFVRSKMGDYNILAPDKVDLNKKYSSLIKDYGKNLIEYKESADPDNYPDNYFLSRKMRPEEIDAATANFLRDPENFKSTVYSPDFQKFYDENPKYKGSPEEQNVAAGVVDYTKKRLELLNQEKLSPKAKSKGGDGFTFISGNEGNTKNYKFDRVNYVDGKDVVERLFTEKDGRPVIQFGDPISGYNVSENMKKTANAEYLTSKSPYVKTSALKEQIKKSKRTNVVQLDQSGQFDLTLTDKNRDDPSRKNTKPLYIIDADDDKYLVYAEGTPNDFSEHIMRFDSEGRLKNALLQYYSKDPSKDIKNVITGLGSNLFVGSSKKGGSTPPPAQGGGKAKDSFPVWKSKNPNGTAAQYKQYKNS